MNVHHLELFYYVAHHEGIVAACRMMPYGIQQPAVSAQVARLERDLGVPLFERRPFRLTPSGQALYDFIAPFFGRLADIEDLIQGKMSQVLRLVGLTEVMREHVPVLLGKLRQKYPDLQVTLQEIEQLGAERLIAQGDADLAITVLESRLPPGFRSVTLAELQLCLLVPSGVKYRRASDLIKSGAAGRETLISLPPHELLPRLFQKELSRRGISWRTSLETSSQDLVAIYVKSGLGVGLSVSTPELRKNPAFRVLPLKGFPTLPIGAFWRGQIGKLPAILLEALKQRSREMLGTRFPA